MTTLTISNTNGVSTMSSVDMVNYINTTREAGKPILRHDSFMDKVPKVLGNDAPKFIGTSSYTGNNAEQVRKVYNFPEREAMLMAMSYSYKLQAVVYDSWKAEEAKTMTGFLLPNFNSPAEAARAWADAIEKTQTVTTKLLEVQQQASEALDFTSTVMADPKVYSFGDAAKLLGQGRNTFIGWLRDNKYVQQDLVPYATAKDFLESSIAPTFRTATGRLVPPTTYVTGKGLVHFQRKLKRQTEKAA